MSHNLVTIKGANMCIQKSLILSVPGGGGHDLVISSPTDFVKANRTEILEKLQLCKTLKHFKFTGSVRSVVDVIKLFLEEI